ncbi:MAG: hypothetical protein HKN58_02255 [Xanthomonadales bacterium]|nr:hypothetical protein [Xanthomonadales bacterium]
MKILFLLSCCICLAGCASVNMPADSGDKSQREINAAIGQIGPRWPASPAQLATTDGEIYLGNLESQIDAIESRPGLIGRTRFQVALAGLYYQRFQIEGRITDAERARELLDEARSSERLTPQDRLVYAQVLLGFHDFDAAAEQLELAAQHGAPDAAVATGRAALDRALQLPDRNAGAMEDSPADYVASVRRAAALVDRGQPAAASEHLRNAQDLYGDVNPFPLAWIHVQQGIVFLRHGAYEQARTFFVAAHERFPQYFLATEHLAETEGLLGNHARSAELYRVVTAQNDQPGFWHGLAGAEAALGNTEAARQASERAREGYRRLLEDYPLMFADHAVGYYLDVGDPAEALRLARLNYEHRQDLSAHLALAEALAGSGRLDEACKRVARLRDHGLEPPEISVPGEPLAACP